ncbi:MAG TPA: hypothetical protein VE153_35735 [Myxococcus sp.]|nr:hypothetical protein [Myxococcus sp.]
MSDETFPAQTRASGDPAVPGEPFTQLRFHYGMLLGAEDFATEQREKVLRRRLHQAMLHGAGTVWGLRLDMGPEQEGRRRQVIVRPGLAVDPLGRDLYVDQDQCLDITGLARHAIWAELPAAPTGTGRKRAHVVLRHETCLAQPVPAITPPCNEPGDAVAYSRTLERFRIDLSATAPADPHALQRDWLAWLRRPESKNLPPRDVLLEFLMTAPEPLTRFWRTREDAPVLLGTVDLESEGTGAATKAYVVAVDNRPRALLPPVQALAELTFGRLMGPAPASTALKVVSWRPEAASGSDGPWLRVELTRAPHAGSVEKAVKLMELGASGWTDRTGDVDVTVDGTALRLELGTGTGWTVDTVYQVFIAGESLAPLVTDDGQPLSGLVAEPSLSGHGRDVSLVVKWANPS